MEIKPEPVEVILTNKFLKAKKEAENTKEKRREARKENQNQKKKKNKTYVDVDASRFNPPKMFYIASFAGVIFLAFMLNILGILLSSKVQIFLGLGLAILYFLALLVIEIMKNVDVRSKQKAEKVEEEKEECSCSKNKAKNLITFVAYDEDHSSKKNFIYGQVKGVEHYATFYVDNNFSVYAMDKFKIQIPEESIILKKK